MLLPSTFRPMIVPFGLFPRGRLSKFENLCPDCRKRNTGLNIDRSQLKLLFLSCGELQKLGMFYLVDG